MTGTDLCVTQHDNFLVVPLFHSVSDVDRN